MTRDGFMFLVMGFTGSKAARMKEAFIEAFNMLEDESATRSGWPRKCASFWFSGIHSTVFGISKTMKTDG